MRRRTANWAVATICVFSMGCGNTDGADAGAGGGNDIGQGQLSDASGSEDSAAPEDTAVSIDDVSSPTADAATKLVDAASSLSDTNTPDTNTADVSAPSDAMLSTDTSTAADPVEWTACDNSDDCVVLEIGCCDHCNGGKLMSVHKKYKDAAKAKHQATGCSGICTEMACAPVVAYCEAGVCASSADPSFPWGCVKLGEMDCKLSPKCGPIWGSDPVSTCANKPSKQVFAGCLPQGQACDSVMTCARNGDSGELMVFPSSCLPEKWKAQKWEMCCPTVGGTCKAGAPAKLGKLCVQGLKGSSELKVGAPVEIVLYPKGCMSSSCTKVHSAVCEVSTEAGGLQVEGQICLEGTGKPGGICTADCNGGGHAKCVSAALPAGKYSAVLGGLKVSFVVPSKAPMMGFCVGSQW